MLDTFLNSSSIVSIKKPELDLLLSDLRNRGYSTVGPCAIDGGIIYREIEKCDELPVGLKSAQSPGSYQLSSTGKKRFFDFIPGSASWKQLLFPSQHILFSATKQHQTETEGARWNIKPGNVPNDRLALVGVRPCELAAIAIQDKVFLRDDFSDPVYRARRTNLFTIAVNCLFPDATCFCTSLGTGPSIQSGFDLCLTELDDVFLVEIGSELGKTILSSRTTVAPSAYIQDTARKALELATNTISRHMETDKLPQILAESLESDRWNEIAKRCLSCANCTQVCPTCFCWDVVDRTDLAGNETTRIRNWDSCFNPAYSYVFGGNTRPNIRSRYRQWLTHKLGTWNDQFGVSGCVGCGRCITWCPAKIDITEEITAIRLEAGK
jgi:sulfhydrogenase subunit beta (sulfur reductase)